MSCNFFITGTDTDAGKTFVTAQILHALALSGESAVGLKPIASGFDCIDGEWRNGDVETLRAASTVELPMERSNRYGFKPAIAPHIAADLAGVELSFDAIVDDFSYAKGRADWVLVEGVGGWLVPLSMQHADAKYSIAGLAAQLDLPVILVVGMRLGCLNHALLTVQAIAASGMKLAGWVANYVSDDFGYADENKRTLMASIAAPLLFEVPFCGANPTSDVQLEAQFNWMQYLRAY